MNKIRADLLDLCRNVKKRKQKEDLNEEEKVRTKPLIFINQEIMLTKIVQRFAKQDEKCLLNFLILVQNMLRAKL